MFRPAANGTTSAAPIAARELADRTVLVVTDAFLSVHYDHNGNILSAKQLPVERAERPRARPGDAGDLVAPPGLGYGNSYAVIDGFGNIVVALVANPNFYAEPFGDIETTKFDGFTGEPLWAAPAIYHAGSYRPLVPTGVFLDRLGDVLVTGLSTNAREHFTLKYDGQTGLLVWGPSILAGLAYLPAHTTSSVDSDGNVVVSAPSAAQFDPADIATVKYSGADGSVLWGPVLFHGNANADSQPMANLSDAGNGVVVTGSSGGQFVTLKYDGATGALIWGPSRFSPPPGSMETAPTTLASDASSNIFVGGLYSPSGGVVDYVTLKLSGESGNVLWTAAPVVGGSGQKPLQLAVFGNGDVAVGGFFGNLPDTHLDFWRERGSEGAVAWGPSEFGLAYDGYRAVSLVASNGRIFVSALSNDGVTLALDSGELDGATGVPAWGPTPFTYPRVSRARFEDLAAGPDGNPVVIGETDTELLVLKYDRGTGSVLWGPVFYAPPDTSNQNWQVMVDANNDALVLAVTQPLTVGPFGVWVFKYSGATGALLWGPTFIQDLVPVRIALDPSGNALVLAWAGSSSALAKVSGADGSVIWGPMVYAGTADQSDYSSALAVDASGNAIVVGTATTSIDYHWFALKYSGTTGALIWGPVGSDVSLGQPWATAVDPAGNVLVSGFGPDGMTTAKYSAANGATLWGPLSVGPGEGKALTIAPNGDVFAAGDVCSAGQCDFATIKYRSSDGVVLWGPNYFDGEAHGEDLVYLLGLGLDAAGNVVVGGTSDTLHRYKDIALLKYDGTTGTTLWGPVYVGGTGNEKLFGFQVRGNSIAVGGNSDGGMLTAVLNESLGIQTAIPSLPPAFCGQLYSFPFVAQNGAPAYTWSIVAGSLPNGLSLSSNGTLAGTPTAQGVFSFRVHVNDSAAAMAERDFTVVVGEDAGVHSILVMSVGACQYQLSTDVAWTSYAWLPGGETTPQITVSPLETTTYGVIVTDASGCALHLSITIPGTALQDPSCLGPAVASISPSSGPSSGGTPVTIAGVNFEPGVQLSIGGLAVAAAIVDPAHLTSTAPALAPGTLNDVVVVNPDSGNAALLKGFLADFLDVPPSSIFHGSIERLFRRGVTAGCNAGTFCPDAHTTRAQMAVFLLKSLLGATYVPPGATGAIFIDVFPGVFAADWIEDLYNRGITAGCVASPLTYCPDADVTRAQMAVFLLRTLLGKNYQPPVASGTVFEDVPANAIAAAWIEDLYRRGLTAGCQAVPLKYCPDAPVRRDEMAAFLVLTFGL